MANDERPAAEDSKPTSSDMIRAARRGAEPGRAESASEKLVREAARSVAPKIPDDRADTEIETKPDEAADPDETDRFRVREEGVANEVRSPGRMRRPLPPSPPAPPRRDQRPPPPAPPHRDRRPPSPPRRDRSQTPVPAPPLPPGPTEPRRRGSGLAVIAVLIVLGSTLASVFRNQDSTIGDTDPLDPVVVTAAGQPDPVIVTAVTQPVTAGNPFAGSWEADDVDGSSLFLLIGAATPSRSSTLRPYRAAAGD